MFDQIAQMNSTRRLRIVLQLAVALILAALIWAVMIPNYTGSRGSQIVAIVNNLIQLDSAKQQWAYEKHETNDVEVTSRDLAPYLTRTGITPIAGEHYVTNSLHRLPEAILASKLEGHPKGTVIRLSVDGTSGGWEVVEPTN